MGQKPCSMQDSRGWVFMGGKGRFLWKRSCEQGSEGRTAQPSLFCRSHSSQMSRLRFKEIKQIAQDLRDPVSRKIEVSLSGFKASHGTIQKNAVWNDSQRNRHVEENVPTYESFRCGTVLFVIFVPSIPNTPTCFLAQKFVSYHPNTRGTMLREMK